MLSLVTLSDQWSENPWKNQGINLVVSEILEKPESFVYIFWDSGENRIALCSFFVKFNLKSNRMCQLSSSSSYY